MEWLSQFCHANLPSFVPLRGTTEKAMKQDILIICGGMLVVGLVTFGLKGIPQKTTTSTQQVVQSMDADPNLKLVTERSPYMRSER